MKEKIEHKTCTEIYKKYKKFDDLLLNIKDIDEICNLHLSITMLREFWKAIKYTALIQSDDGK